MPYRRAPMAFCDVCGELKLRKLTRRETHSVEGVRRSILVCVDCRDRRAARLLDVPTR